MPGEPIVFPVSTAPGVNPGESGGRLINGYAQAAAPGSRSGVRLTRSAGLRPAFKAGSGVFRGACYVGTQLYIINGAAAYVVSLSGGVYTVTPLSGTVPGSGPVFMARNMATTPNILIVHSDGMSQIAAGAVSDFTDPDLPAANSISFLDSYFFPTIGDGRAWASGVNAVTFAGTDYTTAQAKADGLLRSIPAGRDLLLMGSASIEVWSNTANATGFPFSRTAVVDPVVGLWGPYAVAGWEDGYTDKVCFVANDNTVRRLVGYQAVKISNPDLEALIAAVTDKTAIEASVYVDRGRPVFVLTGPTWTWEWSNGQWNERKSYGATRWRAHGCIYAFDTWLAFDRTTTDVYLIDATFKRENADQMLWEVRSTQNHKFPSRSVIWRADFDFMTGVGIDAGISPIETDPTVLISVSFDGGKTFGNPWARKLGKQGEQRTITVRNAGLTKALGVQWRLQISDPVEIGLYGGAMNDEARAP